MTKDLKELRTQVRDFVAENLPKDIAEKVRRGRGMDQNLAHSAVQCRRPPAPTDKEAYDMPYGFSPEQYSAPPY